MDEVVQIDAQHLQEVLNRLTDRRVAVDREVLVLGEPKKGMNDIFRHCRGFERAYSLMLQEADTSFKIRGVVEGLLPDTLRKIPIEKRFNRAYVREICREADGYQPHLVSPEAGIRRLVAEAMKLTEDHVHKFVDEVHIVLQATVREAARRSVLAEAGFTAPRPGMEFLRLKGFENAVVVAADKALEEWKTEAHKVAATMVAMECDYVTPSFFRELEREYQESRLVEAGNGAGAEGEGVDAVRRSTTGDESEEEGGPNEGGPEASPASRGSAISSSAPSPSGRPAPPPLAPAPAPAELKAGWLEKRSGDGGGVSLPVDSWKWQRRWFVVAIDRGALAYFRAPEEAQGRTATPRVTINLRACTIDGDYTGGAANSHLIRIVNRDPALPVAKAHHALVLRCADAADKVDWLGRLRAASMTTGAGGGTAPAGPTGAAARPAGGPPAPAAESSGGLLGRGAAKMGGAFHRFTGLGGSRVATVIEVGAIEDQEAYYERLGSFTGTYARHIYDRMSKAVPKAIILCQVIRSRDRLLDQLYNYLTALKPVEIDALLQEDTSVVKRRAAAQAAAKELEASQAELRALQERRASGESPREAKVPVSARTLLLAGAFPLVPSNVVPRGMDPRKLYGEFTPLALGDATTGPVKLGPPVKRTTSHEEDSETRPNPNETSAQPKNDGASAEQPSIARPSVTGGRLPHRQAPPPPPKLG